MKQISITSASVALLSSLAGLQPAHAEFTSLYLSTEKTSTITAQIESPLDTDYTDLSFSIENFDGFSFSLDENDQTDDEAAYNSATEYIQGILGEPFEELEVVVQGGPILTGLIETAIDEESELSETLEESSNIADGIKTELDEPFEEIEESFSSILDSDIFKWFLIF